VSIVTDVPRNCTYIQRDDTNQTGWIYTEGSPDHVYIESTVLSRWEYYFPVGGPVEPPLFEDGFEGYDFGSGEWDGTSASGAIIDTDAAGDPYSGSEHAICSMGGTGLRTARVYKDFAD